MDAEESPDQMLSTQQIIEVVKGIKTDYAIEIIDDPSSPRIQEVAELDAELFGPHKSLSAEEFKSVIEKGGILFGHINNGNKLISEASLVLSSNNEGASSLERQLPLWLGYCDGAAVSKEYRGKGLQKQLLAAREAVAEKSNKEGVSASVRHRNVPSIKSMFDSGYVMIADAPGYYGEGADNDRVVMLKDFTIENPMQELEADNSSLESVEKGLVNLDKVSQKVTERQDVISIGVLQSDEVDQNYNAVVGQLLRAGYVGVSCHDIDVGDSEGEASDSMVFIRTASLPTEIAERIQKRQSELQTILDYKD